ncbi:MAG TPA: OmpA family protein [Solimonas sp.]|nr:OmpA family protein [Solimonas sp.]
MNKKRIALAMALLSAVATASHAAESSPYLGLMGSWVDPDNGRTTDDEAMGGQLLFGFPFNPWLAGELNFFGHQVRNTGSGNNDQSYGLGGDLVFSLAPRARINPFLLVGGGATYEEAIVGDRNESTVGYANAGGGVMIPLGDSRHTALRLEGRRYGIYADNNQLAAGHDTVYDTRVSAGVQFNFVADEPPPPPPPPAPPVVGDSDRDGVPDNLDRCPGTPAGVRVDAYGCALPLPPPRDSDGDGVVDSMDACPDTPRGMRVDERGCAIKAQRLVLRNINFEFNKATLTADGRSILDGIAAGLRGQPTMEIEIEGHTDHIGTDAYNLKLSKGRANSVRDYLISQGVQASRLAAQGYGESHPVASNKTDEGRAENRRVEFKVIKQ